MKVASEDRGYFFSSNRRKLFADMSLHKWKIILLFASIDWIKGEKVSRTDDSLDPRKHLIKNSHFSFAKSFFKIRHHE